MLRTSVTKLLAVALTVVLAGVCLADGYLIHGRRPAPAGGGAGFDFDSANQATDSGTNTVTVSHTLGDASGNDRYVIAFCGYSDNDQGTTSTSSIYYDTGGGGINAEMTPITADSGYHAYNDAGMYYILDAALPTAAGTFDVTCTVNSTADDVSMYVLSFTGAEQAAYDAWDSDGTTSTSITHTGDTSTTVDTTIIITCYQNSGEGGTVTPDTPQTYRGLQTLTGAQSDYGCSTVDGPDPAAAITTGYDSTNSGRQVLLSAAIGPAP